ncbi:hypothetical protein [Chryseobacterium sp. T1]
MNRRYLSYYVTLLLISACNKSKDFPQKTEDSLKIETNQQSDSLTINKENTSTELQKDEGEEWLKNIFKSKNSDKYFPDYNVEEKLCTARYQEFITESGELYGPSNISDEDFPIAEQKYKTKWSKIYPIKEQEMWLFGRGNGDINELKQLKISKIKDLQYSVFIDYGDGIKTQNEVTLVSENGNYKIDYCNTKFL